MRSVGSLGDRVIPHRRKDIIEKTGRLEAVIRDHEAQLEVAKQEANRLRAQIAATLTESSQIWEKIVKTCYCAEVMNRLPVDTMGKLNERMKQCLQMKDEIERENLAMKKNIERARPMSESLAEEHRELLAENEQLQARLREGMSKSDRETIIRLNDELDRKDEELKEFESDYQERMEEKQLILQELRRELEALDSEDNQMQQERMENASPGKTGIAAIQSAPQIRMIQDDLDGLMQPKTKKGRRRRRTRKPKEETPPPEPVVVAAEEPEESEGSTTNDASTTNTTNTSRSSESDNASNEDSESTSENENEEESSSSQSSESSSSSSSESESTEVNEEEEALPPKPMVSMPKTPVPKKVVVNEEPAAPAAEAMLANVPAKVTPQKRIVRKRASTDSPANEQAAAEAMSEQPDLVKRPKKRIVRKVIRKSASLRHSQSTGAEIRKALKKSTTSGDGTTASDEDGSKKATSTTTTDSD